MKKSVITLISAVMATTIASATIFSSMTLDPGQSVLVTSGTTPGPYDVGGRLTATCQLTDTSFNPPHVSTAYLDTSATFLYIGIIVPSGARAPCSTPVTYDGGTWLPPTMSPFNGYSWSAGIGAGAKTVAWTYLGFPYNATNTAETFCNGFTSFIDNLPNGARC